MKTAFIYGTGLTKHTKAIAEYMASKTGGEAFNAKTVADFDFDAYDNIVIGTNVHAGKPNKHIVAFVDKNRSKLGEKKVHIFISCMFNNEKGETQRIKISEKLGIGNSVFFSTNDPKNESGIPVKADEFIKNLTN